ncbi:hypothetical protein [Burkholderia cenocepacia]|uniref:hypothetical protein n=1 Tax=Burkholderia cenocepacia TaxID=95486 RepID=UPI0022381C72|nr:hypothetical protein [Burkholderia cenocepacia]MCW5156295.1 hypothetical protein [Burkholderia cenocepacia]
MENIMGIREKLALWKMNDADKSWDNQNYIDLRMKDNPNKALKDLYDFIMVDDDYVYEPLGDEIFMTYIKGRDYRVSQLEKIMKVTSATLGDWFELAKVNPFILETDSFYEQASGRHVDILNHLLDHPNLVQHVPLFVDLYEFSINEEQEPKSSMWAKQQLKNIGSTEWLQLANKNPKVLENEVFRDLCYTDWSFISSQLDKRSDFLEYLPADIRESYEASRKENIMPDGKIDLTNKIIPPHFRAKYGDRDFRIATEEEIEADEESSTSHTKFSFFVWSEKGYYEFVDNYWHEDFEKNKDKYVTPEIFADLDYSANICAGVAVNSGIKEYFASEDFLNDYSSYPTGKRAEFEDHLRDDFYEDKKVCLNLARKFHGDFLDKFSPKLMNSEEFIWELADTLRGYHSDLLCYTECDSLFEDEKILKLQREHSRSINTSSLYVLEHRGMINEEFMLKALTEFPQIEKYVQSFLSKDGRDEKYPFLVSFDFYTKVFDNNPKIVKYLTEDQEITKFLFERNKDSFADIARAVCDSGRLYQADRKQNYFIFDIGADHLLSMIKNNEDKDKIVSSCTAFFSCPSCNNEEIASQFLENPQFNDFIKSLDNKQKHILYIGSTAMFQSLDSFFHITEECGLEVDQYNLHGVANNLFGEDYYDEDTPYDKEILPLFKDFYHELKKENRKFSDLPEMNNEDLVSYAKEFLERKRFKTQLSQSLEEKPTTKAQLLSDQLESEVIQKPRQEAKRPRMKI